MRRISFVGAALAALLLVPLGQGFAQARDPSAAFEFAARSSAGSGGIVGAAVWQLFREAEARLDAGDTSAALLLVEEARRTHAEEIGAMAARLRQAVTPRDIRREGDRIAGVCSLLASRGDTESARIVDRVLMRRSVAFFGDSFEALVAWLEGAAILPEADIFVGIVYETDGEADMALSFYERAWEKRDFLDVPDDKITLAYRMADIAAFAGNLGAQENYLLLALADDPLFGTPGNESQALLAMMRTAQEDITPSQASASGVSAVSQATSPAFVKFFALYRNDNPNALKAYRELAALYLETTGSVQRALPAAVLSAVTAFTMLENAVKAYDFEYSYTSFGDTVSRAARHPDIVAWASENKIWDSLLQLGYALMEAGSRNFAMNLWVNLSLLCPDSAAADKATSLMNLAIQKSATAYAPQGR